MLCVQRPGREGESVVCSRDHRFPSDLESGDKVTPRHRLALWPLSRQHRKQVRTLLPALLPPGCSYNLKPLSGVVRKHSDTVRLRVSVRGAYR